MEVINALSFLELNKIRGQWSDFVWNQEFLEVEELPAEYEFMLEEINVENVLDNIIQAIKNSLFPENRTSMSNDRTPHTSRDSLNSSMNGSISWEHLAANNVAHKELLAFLFYLISKGQDLSKSMNSIELSLKATRLYFNLLTIPGSTAFLIYHPNMYIKALDTLKLACKLSSVGKKEKIKPKQKSKPRQIQRNRKPQRNESDEECDEGDDDVSVSGKDKSIITNGLIVILEDLFLLLKKFALNMEDARDQTISHLIDLTKLEVQSSKFNFKNPGRISPFSELSFKAYLILREICSSLHGNVENIICMVLEELLPCVLMVDGNQDNTAHNLNVIREHTVCFIQYLLVDLGPDANKGVYILVQQLCTKITDRAEFRHKGSQTAVDIMRTMPLNLYSKLVKWLFQFAHSSKASHRLFALEVIAKLLYEEERIMDVNQAEDSQNSLLSQRNPSIGMDEHNSIAIDITEKNTVREETNLSPNPVLQDSMHTSLGVPTDSHSSINESLNQSHNESLTTKCVSHKYLLGTVLSRCQDSSGTVRAKALAILAECIKSDNNVIHEITEEIFVRPYIDVDSIDEIETAVPERGFVNHRNFTKSLRHDRSKEFNPIPGAKSIVTEMLRRGTEEKVFVRKAAFQVLESIMKLNRKWMTNNLLEIMSNHCRDPAVSVRKQMIQSLTDLLCLYPDYVFLQKIFVGSVLPQISDPEIKVQEKVLEACHQVILNNIVPFHKLSLPSHKLPWEILNMVIEVKMKRLLSKVCSFWCKTGVIRPNLVPQLQSHIGTENNVPVWLLLCCVSENMKLNKIDFVLEYFQNNYTCYKPNQEYTVLMALEILSYNWEKLSSVEQDKLCEELINALVNFKFSIAHIGPAIDVIALITRGHVSKPDAAGVEWARKIVEKCEDSISKYTSTTLTDEHVYEHIRYLTTIGEASEYCPGTVKASTECNLMNYLFPENLQFPEYYKKRSIQAAVVVTLGKLCLLNEMLAKQVVKLLGCVLRQTKDSVVKVNVVCVLADMCVRYTALVEPFIPDICLCLKDSSVMVRENTLVQLIQLLQQDYLKLKGAFFFNLLSMLCDNEKKIIGLVSYFLTQCLLVKSKNVMYQHLVESIFHYNNFEADEVFTRVRQGKKEAELFSMSGDENRNNRMILYKFMLEHMDDEHRMKITYKICVDILGATVNNKIAIDGVGGEVLKDALQVLSCNEIRLTSLRSHADEEPPTDANEAAAALFTTAKKTIISHCVKRNTIENIVPIIIQLKNKLQLALSPLVMDVMSYIKELMKDYKNEIKEIFAADKTLAAELLYDLKKCEELQKEQRAQSDGVSETHRPDPSDSEQQGVREVEGINEAATDGQEVNGDGKSAESQDNSRKSRRRSVRMSDVDKEKRSLSDGVNEFRKSDFSKSERQGAREIDGANEQAIDVQEVNEGGKSVDKSRKSRRRSVRMSDAETVSEEQRQTKPTCGTQQKQVETIQPNQCSNLDENDQSDHNTSCASDPVGIKALDSQVNGYDSDIESQHKKRKRRNDLPNDEGDTEELKSKCTDQVNKVKSKARMKSVNNLCTDNISEECASKRSKIVGNKKDSSKASSSKCSEENLKIDLPRVVKKGKDKSCRKVDNEKEKCSGVSSDSDENEEEPEKKKKRFKL